MCYDPILIPTTGHVLGLTMNRWGRRTFISIANVGDQIVTGPPIALFPDLLVNCISAKEMKEIVPSPTFPPEYLSRCIGGEARLERHELDRGFQWGLRFEDGTLIFERDLSPAQLMQIAGGPRRPRERERTSLAKLLELAGTAL